MSIEGEDFAAPLISGQIIRKNLIAVSLAYAIGAVAGFAAQVFLARHLGGETFGRYIAAFSLATIINVLNELGGTSYLVREGARDPDRMGTLLGQVLVLKVGVNVAVVGVAVGAAALLGFDQTTLLVAVLFAAMFAANDVARAFRAGLQVFERMEIGAALSIGNVLLSTALIFAVIARGGGVVAAVAASTIVSYLFVPITWLVLRSYTHVAFSPGLRPAIRAATASFPFAMVELVMFGATYADALIIRAALGPLATGLYGAAYRLTIVLLFLPKIFLDSIYRTLSHIANRDHTSFADVVDRSSAALCLLALPLAVGGLLLGPRILQLAFGHDFREAGDAFRILLWSLPFSFPGQVLLTALVVGDRPQSALAVLVPALVINLVSNLVLVPRYGIEAAAWITVVTEALVAGGATVQLVRRRMRLRWPLLAAPGLAVAALMALSIVPLRRLPLFAPLAVGAAVYGAGTLITGVPRRLGFSPAVASTLRRWTGK